MTTQTLEETVFGTPIYGSPEQDSFGNSINFLVKENVSKEENSVKNNVEPKTATKTKNEEGGE